MQRPTNDRSGACFARRLSALIVLGALSLPGMAQTVVQAGVPPAASRGQLLYDNHCVACHSKQMHWRDQRVAVDLASLRAQVLRWQAREQLAWSDADVDDVVRHLNDSIYRFAPPTRTGAAPSPGQTGRPDQPIARFTVASRSSGP
jgi:hypothetical protein